MRNKIFIMLMFFTAANLYAVDPVEKNQDCFWCTAFIVLISLNIVVFVIFFLKYKLVDKKFMNNNIEVEKVPYNIMNNPTVRQNLDEINRLQNELNNAVENNNNLKNENIKLKGDLDSLKEQNNSLKASKEFNNTISVEENNTSTKDPIFQQNINSTTSQKLYVNKFNKNGYFENQLLNTHNSDYSFYVIEILENKGEISFNNNNFTLQKALYSPENYIKPFCDNQNVFKPNASKIITIQPGIVIKEGDLWKIQTKAQIRYE